MRDSYTFPLWGYVHTIHNVLSMRCETSVSPTETVNVIIAAVQQTHIHFEAEMRVVPSKIKNHSIENDGKKDIMRLLANAGPNRYLKMKKQPKIKPRLGIFRNSMWARVRREPPPPNENISTQPPPVAKPITERVKARIDDNLGFLLENKSDRSAIRYRPVESYINLALNNRKPAETVNVMPQLDASEYAKDSHKSPFADKVFQNSPFTIDLTTPAAPDLPLATPFSEFNSTFASANSNIQNALGKVPPSPFDTPSQAIFDQSITINSNDLNQKTFEFNENNSERNSPIKFDAKSDFASDSDDSMMPNFSPKYPDKEDSVLRIPSASTVVDYVPAMPQQPLPDESAEYIRSKTIKKMLEVIRRMRKCIFRSVCDDSYAKRPNDMQIVAGNCHTAMSILTAQQTTTTTTTINESRLFGANQMFKRTIFRNNNVTIMQTSTTARIIRSKAAAFFDNDDFVFQTHNDDF